MKIFQKIRLFTSRLKYFTKHYRSLLLDSKQKIMISDLVQIPNIDKYWDRFILMEQAEAAFKRNLLDELITECRLNTKSLPLGDYQKESLIKSNIYTLKEHSFIKSVDTVIEGFLSCLEQFPYNDKDSVLVKARNLNKLSIRIIRDVVERQYLSWKLDYPDEEIQKLLCRFRASLYLCRSLTNTRRNLELLDSVAEIPKPSVAEKIYLINQKPFDLETIKNFESEIAGLSWHIFRHHCPKTLVHSHQYIVFAVSFLKDLGFSETQIQNGLHYLYLRFKFLLRRLNSILEHPELSKFRDDNHFLGLLFLTQSSIKKLVDERKMSFADLLEVPKVYKPKRAVRIQYVNVNSILYLISQFYSVSDRCSTIIKRHPRYRFISERQIHDTLQFLRSNNFTAEEVEDSISIIFYSRELIEKVMEEIKSKEATLVKCGLIGGCAPEKTNFFKYGTKEKRKILQLCLYYLEKPLHFSGEGVWSTNDNKDVC